jgi:hypothetical protein
MPSFKLGRYNASIKFQMKETGKMLESKWLLFVDSITSLEDFFAIYIPFECEFLVAQRSNGTED